MKPQRFLAYFGLLAAGCGMRVIGNLGDDTSGVVAGASGSGGTTNTAGVSALPTALGGSSSVTTGGMPMGGNATTGGALTNNGGSAASTGGTISSSGAAGDGGAQPTDASDAGMGGLDSAGAGGQGGEAPSLPPLTAVPVVHLQLDDCTGPIVDTQSQDTGARYDVDCSEGVLGKAAHFSATPSENGARRLEFADAPRLAFSQELTVAAWVKPEPGPYLQAIVDKWYALDMFELGMRYVMDGDGKWSPRFAFSIAEPEGDWGRPAEAISPSEVDFEHWSHVAGVYRWSPDGQVGHITLYVNGEAVAETSTKVGTAGLQQSMRPLMVGYADQGAQFVGSIDEVRLYDVALGPELGWLFLEPAHP